MITTPELEAADRALCEFEDARARPVITASAWGEQLVGRRTSACKDADQMKGRMDAPGRQVEDETPAGPPQEAA